MHTVLRAYTRGLLTRYWGEGLEVSIHVSIHVLLERAIETSQLFLG
jgi:hypothetical protein